MFAKLQEKKHVAQRDDPELFAILEAEDQRQQNSLEMIASENFASPAVLAACASTLTNKYAEGYPEKRYYNGCEYADKVEKLAIARAKQLFDAAFVNVQAHSGSQANMAAFFAFLQPGDKIMGMDLHHGGHLTHGSKVNFSGRYFDFASYGVRQDTHRIDMDQLCALAREHRPKMIIAGASAYPRTIDFAAFRQLADDIDALLLADIAHIAGLIAVKEHPSPIGIAHVTTSTTHKTLRGPRGGMIFCNTPLDAKRIDAQIFPGIQGGPFMHMIAAKAVALSEALSPDFHDYILQVKNNAAVFAQALLEEDLDLVSGGTDNHIVLLDLKKRDLSGAQAADALHEIGITANKNAVPFDPKPPRITSGVRFGSAALTTRGLGADEFRRIASIIAALLADIENSKMRALLRSQVQELTDAFPMEAFRLF